MRASRADCAERHALRQRPVEVLRERRRRRVEHAVLVGDERRQAVRDQRLRDALVEVGAAAACRSGTRSGTPG